MISSSLKNTNTKKTSSCYEAIEPQKHSLVLEGKRFHFIGIGGVGTSGLAHLMIKNGVSVSGSDICSNPFLKNLKKAGAEIKIGHDPKNISPLTDAVVITAAIKDDNPELVRAKEMGLKIYKYAQALGMVMDKYKSVAVSGTHGKSTASAWLACCLREAAVDPNFIIGAQVSQLDCSASTGKSRLFIAEACEYDRSFLSLKPNIGCILNIEADHLDYYKDEDEIVRTFAEFANAIKPGGSLIANGDDENVKKAIGLISDRIDVITFGLDKNCDFYASDTQLRDGLYSFDVFYKNNLLGRTKISLAGRHNILNALAVIAMAVNCGLDHQQALDVIPSFTGIERRLMFKDRIGDITIIDDYAHHPTEIRASLEAIQQLYNPKRLWCVFQPHQYSRTKFFLDDFAKSFNLADKVIIPEIYFVRDCPETKKIVNAKMLAQNISSHGTDAVNIDSFSGICEHLKKNVRPGDLVVTMGAGNIWKVADEYIRWLRKNS
ncbi:MAG: UDP-N-acetylmuramate--L-alanine ligase [Planctomycetes bacterium]|nr:UDP-N-acetylmuramate--L-alanine ligase [Planctomycetota bacterium]